MDADSWTARLFSASRRYQSSFPSRSGAKWDGFDTEMSLGFEEIEMNDDAREEYSCPFCSEFFDIVGLCCHIDDEHSVEAKNGVCPVCAVRVGVDMVAHITLQHGNIFKMHRKRKSCKGGSHSSLSLLRRELREGNLHSLFEGSSYVVSSSNAAPDPLLSSFILPVSDNFGSSTSSETASIKKSTIQVSTKRKVEEAPLSIKDQEENAKRSEFIEGLLLSTIFVD